MSERGDCRRLKRARYHQWLRRRWAERAKAAEERRRVRCVENGGGA